MALVEGCKHELEITVPVEAVQRETDKVVASIQKKVNLPGFRPGKAPAGLVRQRFPQEIRQEVLEHLLPKAFREKVDEEKLQVVGTPDVTEVHFHDNEPLRFKAAFEVAPDIALGTYKGVEVPYAEPVVSDEDVDTRLSQLREQKADYVNEDPRPLQDGDFAVVDLASTGGVAEAIDQKDLQLHIGGADTLPGFSEHLRGMSPGDEKEFEVTYPEDYGSEQLAGKSVSFRVKVTGVRRKELPELNDEFAKDLGDFQTMDELRNAVRQAIFKEREFQAQNEAKHKLVEKLIDTHEFPIPEAYVDRQVESQVESQLRRLGMREEEMRNLKLDWNKIRDTQKEKASRDVKGSLLLEKIADVEQVQATEEEIDSEIQRFAKQEREPLPAVRQRFRKDGTDRKIAAHIRTEKTLQMLFDNAQKVTPPPSEEPAAAEPVNQEG